jgi:hypothetical protein
MKEWEQKNLVRQTIYNLQKTFDRYCNSIDLYCPLATVQLNNTYNWALSIMDQLETSFPLSCVSKVGFLEVRVYIENTHYRLINTILNNSSNGSK